MAIAASLHVGAPEGWQPAARPSFFGTVEQVATQIDPAPQADGNVPVRHVTPGGLDEFADAVTPILPERERFGTKDSGPTLRDHVDVARPGPTGWVSGRP